MKLRQLPLFAIRAFAVTARTGSVGRAATELSVTHGAVSRHLSNLEEWLGQKLFVRHGRQLRLTPVGALLSSRAEHSLRDILSLCSEIRGSPRRRQISVVGPGTFSMYWLLPRIESYEAQEKDVEIWLTTRMANENVDFFGSDLIVTRGPVTERQSQVVQQTVLFEEVLTVLAAPSFLTLHPIASAADVVKFPRVAALTRPSDWTQWLEVTGVADDPTSLRHRFDHQFVAMHAVREGIGSIVGPRNLFLKQEGKDFVCPLPNLTLRGQPYLVHHRAGEPKYVERFLKWLNDEARKDER
jgi:LysR family glycine cleavage system transcriptional activator